VHQLKLTGARLKGADVRLVLDGATYVAGENTHDTDFAYTLGRLLEAGPHRLALNINGQVSRTIDFEV
jgi:hypothetical protein